MAYVGKTHWHQDTEPNRLNLPSGGVTDKRIQTAHCRIHRKLSGGKDAVIGSRSRIKGRRLAGLGTDVPLDRQQDPHACFLLHVGNLAAPICSPPVPDRLARSHYGTTAGTTHSNTAVHFAVSSDGRQRPQSRRHCSIQADSCTASPRSFPRPRQTLYYPT